MAHQKLKPTYDLTENKIKALKQIVPEAFEDGKINFDTLRECLGDLVEDSDDERFGLVWPGKKEARRLAAIPSKGTLVPVYGEGLKADGTPDTDGINDSKNIFIEGENLEVLKILQKSYAGRIKMIYIDPPYNTGSDFVYDDNFTEPLEHYLRRTGQIDEDGKALTTNKKSDGRFHSKWLDMMYPRLKLARELLKEDGVIFISIGKEELHHLITLANEVFTEFNLLATIVWKSGRTSASHFTHENEYILGYSKSIENLPYFKYKGTDKIVDRAIKKIGSKNPASEIKFKAGVEFLSEDKIFPNEIGGSEKVFVVDGVFQAENGKLKNDVTLKAGWSMRDMIEEWLLGKKVYDQKGQVVSKFFFKENGILQSEKIKSTTHPKTTIDFVSTKKGTREVESYFGKTVFDYPKPTEILTYLTSLIIDTQSEYVLDFFAGSSTFGDAINKFNKSENLNTKYLLVQMDFDLENQETDTAKNAIDLGYKNFIKLSSDRLRKSFNGSDGFKYFKLGNKQINDNWTSDIKTLFSAQNDWSNKDLLFEIILSEGFPLDSTLVEIKVANLITKVICTWFEFSLIICLDEEIQDKTIEEIDPGDDIFICFDHAISDQGKLRLSDKGLIKTIG